MAQALYADALRGFHSTGLIRIKDDKADYYKRALPAADFIDSRVFKQLMRPAAEAYIGHNRAATMGAINNDTAHPFHHGNIIGVHNGTLDAGWKNTLTGTFDVDSEALIANIDLEGIEATVAKAEGAFAIVYYDLQEGTVNIIRNDERPMYYGKLSGEKEDRWAFASEGKMLDWLVHRVDKAPLEEVLELPVGQLATFDPNTGDVTFTKMEVAAKRTVVTGSNYGNYYNYNNSGANVGKPKTPTATHIKQVGDDSLKEVGLKKGDEVDFVVTESTVNSGNKSTATVEGWAIEEPFCRIRMYGAPKDLSFQAHYIGVLERALEVDGQLVIILDSDDIIELEDKVGKEDKSTTLTLVEGNKQEGDAVVRGPGNIYISIKEFDRITDKGCSCCGNNVFPYQSESVVWTLTGDPICPSCVGEYGDLLSGYVQ